MWWYILLILAVRRQRQVGICEFNASLVYVESSKSAKASVGTFTHVYIHIHGI